MTRILTMVRSPRGVMLAVSLVAFLVYLRTLAPGVDFIDAGELTTVAWTLGIAHPTGYPLFTLLGWALSHLPVGAEPVVRMNLMAAACCAAALVLYLQIFLLVIRRSVGSTVRESDPPAIAAAAGGTLMLAFSETYWSQAVAVEVYSLHLLLVAVVVWSFLRADEGSAGGSAGGNRWWYLFAYVLGLSFANHMTTILLAPAFLVYYFMRQGWHAVSWRRIGSMVPFFLAGLSVYVYLPVRAARGPIMNWGEPTTLERFFWHFSGKQFRVWIFSSGDAAARQFSYFLTSLPSEHAYVGLALAAIGCIALWRRSAALGICTVLLFVSCVAYSINYDIHDIDSYFLLAYIVVALWASVGIFQVGRWVLGAGWNRRLVVLLMVGVGLVPLVFHARVSDESGNHLVDDYTRNMFASLQPSAIVLSYQWDFWVSASYYEQLVRGERTDVAVIDKELLRRSWYFKQLERRYPWLIEQSRAEVDAFLEELDKFEHDRPYNPAVIQGRYVAMIRSFILRNLDRRPVYVTPEIEAEFTRGLQRIPEGLALRLAADTLFHPTAFPQFTYRPFGRPGRLEEQTRKMYADALALRGQYYLRWGEASEAEKALRFALVFDPTHPFANQTLRTLGSRPR